MTGDKCMFRGCKNTRSNSSKIFHPIPLNEDTSKKWIINSGKYLSKSYIRTY